MSLPAVDRLPAHLTTPGAKPDLLKAELLDLITRAITNHPRSLQVQIGPSEVGHACPRRIGYKLLGHPENPGEPNWKATVGTAIHAWLEEVMITDNRARYAELADLTRWIVEATVDCGEVLGHPITGHCDLFDRVTGTVVDWKTCGPTQLKKYKAKGPGPQYRTQAHLYGRGWQHRGQDVHHVASCSCPVTATCARPTTGPSRTTSRLPRRAAAARGDRAGSTPPRPGRARAARHRGRLLLDVSLLQGQLDRRHRRLSRRPGRQAHPAAPALTLIN